MVVTQYGGPVRFSWSAAEKWDQCGRKGWHHYADQIVEPAKPHLVKGTFVHRVLELAVAERVGSVELLRGLARRVFDDEIVPGDDWAHVRFDLDESEFRRDAWWHIGNGIQAIVSGRVGIPRHVELEINTRLGGVPFTGFVDMVSDDGDRCRTLDWKTGKVWDMKAGTWRGGPAWNRKKLFQPVLYATAVEELLGRRVDGGIVVFTAERPVEVIAASDELRGEAVEWLGGVWDRVAGWVAAGEAPASTGPLCGWCHHVSICPEGREAVAGRVGSGKPVSDDLGWLVAASPAARAEWVETGVQIDAGFDLESFRARHDVDDEDVEPLPEPSEEGLRWLIDKESQQPVPRVPMLRFWIRLLSERFGVEVPMPEISLKPRHMDDSELLDEVCRELARDKPRKTRLDPLRKEAAKRGLRLPEAA